MTRWLVFLALLALASAEAWLGHRWWAVVPCLLVGALLLVGYFRNGTVWLAWRALKRRRFDRARRLLAMIRFPGRLAARQRPFYEYLCGVIPVLSGGKPEDPHEEVIHLQKARDDSRGPPDLRCAAIIGLVEHAILAGDFRSARTLLEAARKTPHGPALDAVIAEAEERTGAAEAGAAGS